MIQYIKDNPALAVVVYLALTAGVSLLVAKLEGSPRGQAVLKILAALGVDLPKVGEGLAQLFGGSPPGGPPAGGSTPALVGASS